MKAAASIIALLMLATASPALAAPPAWAVAKAQSQVGFSGTQSGSAFKGSFGQWDAAILFDPKDLAHSSARVSLVTGSAKTGDQLQDSTLLQGEWFNTAKFPRATFVTTQISAAGPNRYIAKGTLTIKGKTLPVTLPFTLVVNGDTAVMRGQTSIDRVAFNLGAQSDASGTYVSKQIAISISLTAKRGK